MATQSANPSRRILLAIVLPLVAQAILIVPLGVLETRGWHHLTEVAVTLMLVAVTGGFLYLIRPLTKGHAAIVAIVYYPIMLGLSSFLDIVIGLSIFGVR